jgi:hypothetical protein
MSYILFGGVKYMQTIHALCCNICEETIVSKDLHDLQYCKCGSIGIDGGVEVGNRIIGNIYFMESRSMYCAFVNKKRIWLPINIIEAHFNSIRNKFI